MHGTGAEALRIKSLSEAVRERIMREIARGRLKPGARLNEAQTAQALGVSRGPIREAARELEGQGFLVSRPNQGFFVADFAPDDIRYVYEAKDWLETAFVADLAVSLPLAERRKILAEIDALDSSDRLAFTETLFAFRARVLARLNNRFLADLMTVLYRKFYIISVVVDAGDDARRVARIAETLRRFWAAMARDDLEAASAVLRDDTAYWLADLPPRFAPHSRPSTRLPA
jgi:DNA-binding GntR family transcriptional regulator